MLREELQAKLQDVQVEPRLEAVRALTQLDEFPEELFVQALGDADWRVRKEAVSWFLHLPDSGARIGFVLRQLQHPDNAGLRNAAIEILIGLGTQAVPELTTQLAISDAEVRKFIVDILGEIGSSSCIKELLPLLRDADENVCYAAVETLGKLRATEAVGPLLELLDSAATGLRFTIFEALSSIGIGVPAERLLPYCRDRLLRKTVYSCLGRIADPEALPALLEGLSDPLRKVREAAVSALGALIVSLDQPAVQSVIGPLAVETRPQLVELLSHQDLEMRTAACHVLSLMPDPETIEQLIPLLADEELRPQVVSAFKRIPAAFLSNRLSAAVPAEKAVFWIYLAGELQLQAAAPLAIRMLTSEDPQLRYASVLTLGKIAHIPAATLLTDALADAVPEIQNAAAAALKQLAEVDAEAVIDAVSPYLDSSDADLRLLAVRTLGGLVSERVEDCLLMALKDFSAQVRCEALRGLNEGNSQHLLTGLTLALTDEVADVRRLAAEALGVFPAEKMITLLFHAVEDPDPWVRMAALRAVRGGTPQELQAIIARGLADPVGLVVISALESAVRLLPDRAEETLTEALEHQDEEVMRAAIRLLLAAGFSVQVLSHRLQKVRLSAVSELPLADCAGWKELLEERGRAEEDPAVRQAIAGALRRSAGA